MLMKDTNLSQTKQIRKTHTWMKFTKIDIQNICNVHVRSPKHV